MNGVWVEVEQEGGEMVGVELEDRVGFAGEAGEDVGTEVL